MRVLGVVVAALALALPAAAAGPTSLTITFKPESGTPRTWTLRCGPSGGTLPKAAAACTRLAALRAPFAVTQPIRVCTQVYGGPQTARVRGVFRGARIDTTFTRRNGCEIQRWNRVGFLFPAFSGTLPPPR